MVKRSRGIRTKSRHILRKKPRDRGLSPITKALQEFEIGENVNIKIDPSIHKGMPHPKFQGRTGKVQGKQGESYVIGITEGKKSKTLVIRPEHLGRVS